MPTIKFYCDGVEYTTRHELALKYPALSTNKLQRALEKPGLLLVHYKNQFFFEKASTEQLIEKLLQK